MFIWKQCFIFVYKSLMDWKYMYGCIGRLTWLNCKEKNASDLENRYAWKALTLCIKGVFLNLQIVWISVSFCEILSAFNSRNGYFFNALKSNPALKFLFGSITCRLCGIIVNWSRVYVLVNRPSISHSASEIAVPLIAF